MADQDEEPALAEITVAPIGDDQRQRDGEARDRERQRDDLLHGARQPARVAVEHIGRRHADHERDGERRERDLQGQENGCVVEPPDLADPDQRDAAPPNALKVIDGDAGHHREDRRHDQEHAHQRGDQDLQAENERARTVHGAALPGRRHAGAAESARQRQREPRDQPQHDRQRGRHGDVRVQCELGVDHHRQHVDVGCQREGGAEGAHRSGEADGAGGDECGTQRRQDDVAEHLRGRRAERARRLLERGIELLGRCHDGEQNARDREIEIADQQARHRIGEDDLLAGDLPRDLADETLPSGEQDHHEADDDARKRERKGEQRREQRASRETVAREQQGNERRQRERDRGGRRRQRQGGHEARQVARRRKHAEISRGAFPGEEAAQEQLAHWHEEERADDDGERKRQQKREAARGGHGSWIHRKDAGRRAGRAPSIGQRDFRQVAIGKALLHQLHFRVVDGRGASVLAVGQEFAADRLRQLHRPRRLEERIRPQRLALVGQHVVEHLLALGRRSARSSPGS